MAQFLAISIKLINKSKLYNSSNHGFYFMPKSRSLELVEKQDIPTRNKLLKIFKLKKLQKKNN